MPARRRLTVSADGHRQVVGKIRHFLAAYCRHQDLADDDDFFARGFVSSLVAMQLVLFVEKEFAVTIENEDLDLANFRTMTAIANLIARKRGEAA
jgi:acyl carrier protein